MGKYFECMHVCNQAHSAMGLYSVHEKSEYVETNLKSGVTN